MRTQEATGVCIAAGPHPSRRNVSSRIVGALGLLAISLGLAACQTDGNAAAGGRALAFDSIDGAPKDKFEKLVGDLSTEADARRVPVVSRETNAAYRVKGYLALHVDRGKANVAYAWDVYDAEKTRVARISGVEAAGAVKGGSDGWAACNDAVLAKIADRSMAELSETLGLGGTAAPATGETAPAQSASAQASQPGQSTPDAAASGPKSAEAKSADAKDTAAKSAEAEAAAPAFRPARMAAVTPRSGPPARSPFASAVPATAALAFTAP